MAHRYDPEVMCKIPGFLHDEEGEWLYRTSTVMRSVIEIGSLNGKSSYCLACSGVSLYCVDIKITAGFIENMKPFSNVVAIEANSKDVSDKLRDVDMVFIDGDHEYESVKSDIELYMPKCKVLICGHDYGTDWPGVDKAVNELIPNVKRACQSIWYKEI